MKYPLNLWVIADPTEEEGFRYMLTDKSHYMYSDEIFIDEVIVDFNPPENLSEDDLRKKAIQTLKDQQQKILADAQMRSNKLQEKIDKMLLLTHVSDIDVPLPGPKNPVPPKPEIIDPLDDIPF